jgi:hypothetical protein
MSREIKFRGKNKFTKKWVYGFYVKDLDEHYIYNQFEDGAWSYHAIIPETLGQFINLKDSTESDYYIGDIAEFPNDDRFVLKFEDHLEVVADWIGDVECEDQTRDLYRIEDAEIIGNEIDNPELIK